MDTADRAWITVSYAHLISPLVVGQNPTVRIEFVNNGRTPALDVQTGGNVYSRSSALPLEIRHNMQGEQKSQLPLGPGIPGTTFMEATEPFRNQGQIDVIVAGTHTLYGVGFITYNDAAGNGRRTDFCFKTGGANLKVTDETGYVMVACPIGNTAT